MSIPAIQAGKTGLRLAETRTEAVLIGHQRVNTDVKFQVGNVTIKPSKAIKYLEIWLDQKIIFGHHIQEVTAKVDKTTAALCFKQNYA